MQVKFIGPNTFNYVRTGREYTVNEERSTDRHFCIYNDIQKECLYLREYFEHVRVKLVKQNNAFEFIAMINDMTHGKIYHVDFDQSSASHYSIRNDKKSRLLMPKFFFRKPILQTVLAQVAHDFAAASIARQEECERVIAALHSHNSTFDHRSSSTHQNANVIRREYEFSTGWAKANPELMGSSLVKLIEENPATEWNISVDNSRVGFILFVAKRK